MFILQVIFQIYMKIIIVQQTIQIQIDDYNDKYNQLLCEYEKLLNYIRNADKKNIYSYLSEIK